MGPPDERGKTRLYPWLPYQALPGRSAATNVLVDIDLACGVHGNQRPDVTHLRSHGTVFPCVGLWPAYKHCVQAACCVFLPFLIPLQCKGYLRSPTTTTVFTSPTLIATACLFMAAYLAWRHSSFAHCQREPLAVCVAGAEPELCTEWNGGDRFAAHHTSGNSFWDWCRKLSFGSGQGG